ncbi:uncharacterized protein LOC141633661 [Silene latifolia]|uniref:uncharacterized protein LOC141633661 n=1 Tax=Silene latifolia TaxID=37657 RepID=UPI003D788A19
MADHPASNPSTLNPDEEVKKSADVKDGDQEGIEALAASLHNKSPDHHDEETHGTSDDIDENTPPEAVKGPNVFQRAKEEVEAVFEAILPKKDSEDSK